MSNLRDQIVKLAYDNPGEIRDKLLPVLAGKSVDINKLNAMLAHRKNAARKGYRGQWDETKLDKLDGLAQSRATAAYRKDERWGGPSNATTYPKKHYAYIEGLLGIMGAQELGYFDDVYDAYMAWETSVR